MAHQFRRVMICVVIVFVVMGGSPTYGQTSGKITTGLPPPIAVQTPSVLAHSQYESLSSNAIEKAWNNLDVQYGGFLPDIGSEHFVDAFLPGSKGFNVTELGNGFARFLLQTLWEDSRLLGTLIILATMAAILETVQTAFESQLVGRVAFLMVHLVLLVLAVTSFHQATEFARGAIDTMTAVMYGSLPVVLALIAASGGLTSAAAFHPLIVFIVNAMGFIIQNWVFPMIFLSAVLLIVSTISSRYQITELAGFLRNVTMGVLGLGMSAFLGIMSVQGSLTSIADGVSLRSAKFVASTFVPVVGKAFSDASESIAGASLIVKNAAGIGTAVMLLLVCAFPAVKILALSMVYSGSAALIQPLGNSPIVSSLATIGKSLTLVFAALAAMGLMFFFSMVIAIATTNLTAFVR